LLFDTNVVESALERIGWAEDEIDRPGSVTPQRLNGAAD